MTPDEIMPPRRPLAQAAAEWTEIPAPSAPAELGRPGQVLSVNGAGEQVWAGPGDGPVLRFRVDGEPKPQGSKTAFVVRKGGKPTGRAVVVDDNKKSLKPWRQAVIDAAHDAARKAGGWDMLTGPVKLSVVFILPRPKVHYGTGRNAGTLRPGAPVAHSSKPDRDKLERAVMDALSDAGMWRDDAQVYDGHSIKLYEGPRLRPGAVITIEAH